MNAFGFGKNPSALQTSKSYNTIIEFAKFLRENGDRLFEKDAKLCLKTDQLFILQEYLQRIQQPIAATGISLMASQDNDQQKNSKRKNSIQSANSNKEFLMLYKSNQLHLIQDFLFKITNLKIVSDTQFNAVKDYAKLNIFGSLTYLEIKNCPINNVLDLQNLRNQLEVLICIKSVNKLQDLLQFSGADQSSPLNWPKLHTLNLSHNNLVTLDNSLRLTTSIEILDLSHNSLKECSVFLQNLTKLKRLNLSFNKLELMPNLCVSNNISNVEHLDLSYNKIEIIDIENISKLALLKHINLAHNLINDLIQINHLRLLTSINQISIVGNPVQLNLKCEFIVKEILAIVSLKNSMKTNNKQNQTSLNWGGVLQYNNKHLTATSRINIKRNLTFAQKLNSTIPSQVLSVPNKSFLGINPTANARLDTRRPVNYSNNQRKLKAHNVLIEQDGTDEPGESNGTSFVSTCHLNNTNKNTSEFVKDISNISDIESIEKKFLSTSIGDYDSSKLQTELENLKKLRQNYGTDWLLSTPSLIEINKQLLNEKIANKLDKHNNLNPPPRIEISKEEKSAATTSSSISKLATFDEMQNRIQLVESELNVLESFAVYLSIQTKTLLEKNDNFELEPDAKNNDSGEGLSNACLCIISLSDKYLIEKDETNSDTLHVSEYASMESIDLLFTISNQEVNQIRIKLKQTEEVKIYQFENQHEINSFVDCMRNILFNETNLEKCELYYCHHCVGFGKKSKLKINEADFSDNTDTATTITTRNLTCTKCSKYLIKEGRIQTLQYSSTPNEQSLIENSVHNQESTPPKPHSLVSKPNSQTLKEVLSGFKAMSNEDATSQNLDTSSSVTNETNQLLEVEETEATNENATGDEIDSAKEVNLDDRLKSLFSNDQISKKKLDEINSEARHVNNNLKLYLVINVMNADQQVKSGEKRDEAASAEEETMVCKFKLKYLVFNNARATMTSSKKLVTYEAFTQEQQPLSSVQQNCVCVFTNKNLILFKIVNEESYRNNCDFDKCLKQEYLFSVNQIEFIEIGLGQSYFLLEVIVNSETCEKHFFKFVTLDVYQTQAYISNLLKIINESKSVPMLKQIKKTNEETNKNLEIIINRAVNNKDPSKSVNLSSDQINMFTFIDSLNYNNEENVPNRMFEEKGCLELFIYNSERLLLVEENLGYFQNQSAALEQFNLIEYAKIGDIVNLKLYKENENRIEISFVDELRNSKQISWSFDLNKQFLLSQLITQLKEVWEKIFLVELPINF